MVMKRLCLGSPVHGADVGLCGLAFVPNRRETPPCGLQDQYCWRFGRVGATLDILLVILKEVIARLSHTGLNSWRET